MCVASPEHAQALQVSCRAKVGLVPRQPEADGLEGATQTSAFTSTPDGTTADPSPQPHTGQAVLGGAQTSRQEGVPGRLGSVPLRSALCRAAAQGGPCHPRTTSQHWVQRWVPASPGEASPHSRENLLPLGRIRPLKQPLSAHCGPPHPPPTPAGPVPKVGPVAGGQYPPALRDASCPGAPGPAQAAGRTGLGLQRPSLPSSDSEGRESGGGAGGARRQPPHPARDSAISCRHCYADP